MKTIPELDGVRAIAVLAVLAFHLGLIPGGMLGVDLFFVLSGFLITTLLIHERRSTGSIDLLKFYIRRALRILPPIAMTAILAVALWPESDIQHITAAVPAAILFYANFLPVSEMGPLSHTWSLSIEEHFYLLWPALFLAVRRRAVVALSCVIGAALVLRAVMYAMGADADFLYRFTFTWVDALAIGCLAAFLYKPGVRVSAFVSALFFCATMAALALPRAHSPWLIMGGYTALSLLFAGFILSSISAPSSSIIRTLLASKVMRYIGQRSYGIYLFHWPIFVALEPFRQTGNIASFALIAIAKLALSLVIVELSFRTVETFALSFRGRFRSTPVIAIRTP